MAKDRTNDAKKSGRGGLIYFLLALLVLVAAVAAYFRLQGDRDQYLQVEARARASVLQAGPRVRVATAVRGPAERRLQLVGEAQPYLQATIYAKVGGYLGDIKVDNGDRVTQGQLLALIQSPELDRQYEAAVADAKNKDKEAKRSYDLLPRGAASKEQAEEREAAAEVARANVAALQAQKDYEIIRAPFTGTITARYVDPGALIQNAVNAQGSATPVVTVSQVDRLKIYAYADQKNAGFIRVGDRADIWDPTRSAKKISATLSRTNVQLNARTRTLILEFDVDNSQGVFVPGSFVQISLVLRTPPYVEVPIEALTFRGDQPYALVVTPENRVNLRAIGIAESDGKVLKLQSGIHEGDQVVINGGDAISDGDAVQPSGPTSK